MLLSGIGRLAAGGVETGRHDIAPMHVPSPWRSLKNVRSCQMYLPENIAIDTLQLLGKVSHQGGNVSHLLEVRRIDLLPTFNSMKRYSFS